MSGEKQDIHALRQGIAQTRAELGETVEELAAKADVKARAQEKVSEVKARAGEIAADTKAKAQEKVVETKVKAQELATEFREDPAVPTRRAVRSVQENPRPWLIAVAAAVVVGLLIARRRRSRAKEW